MADRAIIKIEVNDSDQRMRMKINSNFQQLARGTIVDGQLKESLGSSQPFDPDAILAAAFNMMYPVGAGFFTNNVNDSRLSRGTWRRVEGKFILASDSAHPVNQTGGKEQITLTTNELPAHTHGIIVQTSGSHTHPITVEPTKVASFSPIRPYSASGTIEDIAYTGDTPLRATASEAGAHAHTATITSTGSGQPYNNLPPYISRYYFERIG